jgi:hypothetical protein
MVLPSRGFRFHAKAQTRLEQRGRPALRALRDRAGRRRNARHASEAGLATPLGGGETACSGPQFVAFE